MKIGMPILFEYDSIEQNFILAKELGFDFVELNLNFSYCRKALENGEAKELANKYALETTLHFFDEADFGSYEEVVDGYLALLNKYASLGKGFIKMMNFHNNPGPVVTISGEKNFIYEKEYEEYIERLLKNFKKAKNVCDENGIRIVIENTDTAPKATFMRQVFLDEDKAGFHFNYDIGHDSICGYMIENLLKEKELSFDEFHFHDSDGKRCHLSLGEGTMGGRLKSFKELATKNNAYVLLEVKSKEDLVKSIKVWKNI